MNSKSEEKKFGTALADIVQKGKAFGIEMDCVNPLNGFDEYGAYFEAKEKAQSRSSDKGRDISPAEKENLAPLLQKAVEARTVNDQALAEKISTVLNGNKGVLLYGSGHSVWNVETDLDAQLTKHGISNARIEIYENMKEYQRALECQQKELRDAPGLAKHGDDPPELIYVRGEGKIYFTPNTPEAMKADIQALTTDAALKIQQDIKPESPKPAQAPAP